MLCLSVDISTKAKCVLFTSKDVLNTLWPALPPMCGQIFYAFCKLGFHSCFHFSASIVCHLCTNLMQDEPPAFPCVLKVGHAHGGLGKVKVEGETSWKDLARSDHLWDTFFAQSNLFQRCCRFWPVLHCGGVHRCQVRLAHLQVGWLLPGDDVGLIGGAEE